MNVKTVTTNKWVTDVMITRRDPRRYTPTVSSATRLLAVLGSYPYAQYQDLFIYRIQDGKRL